MGTGSVDDRYGNDDSYCRRCLSPFSGGDTGAPWKKGTGTESAAFFRRFGICGGSEPVPIFHSTFTIRVRRPCQSIPPSR